MLDAIFLLRQNTTPNRESFQFYISIFLEIFKYKTCSTYIKHAEILAHATDTCPLEQKVVAVFCSTSLFCLQKIFIAQPFVKLQEKKGFKQQFYSAIQTYSNPSLCSAYQKKVKYLIQIYKFFVKKELWYNHSSFFWRGERDSNPRKLSFQQFSRLP